MNRLFNLRPLAKVNADISGGNLEKVIRLVGIRADVMEKELASADKF